MRTCSVTGVAVEDGWLSRVWSGCRPSDERRVHRPLESGDLDLDLADQVDRLSLLVAAVWRGVPAPARLSMECQQFGARVRQLNRADLVMGHGNLRTDRDGAYPMPASQERDATAGRVSRFDHGQKLASGDLLGGSNGDLGHAARQ